jgi:hypothetical protein
MRNEDVEELFEIVQTGDVVELVPERNEEIAKLFEQPAPSTIASIAIPAMRGAE